MQLLVGFLRDDGKDASGWAHRYLQRLLALSQDDGAHYNRVIQILKEERDKL